MSNAIAVQQQAQPATVETVERLVTIGDLAQLTPQQRSGYYIALCRSLGLKPELLPFEFLKLNGKTVLYAKKSCAEQLRQGHGISIYQLDERETGENLIVTAYARNGQGREDIDQGVVSIKGLHGDVLANARMKAITKAKRRVTLSLCGLGMLDESEIETIRGANGVGANGWNCAPDTAALLIKECDEARQKGVTTEQMVALLPAGLQSRQQLTEAQAQLFLSELERLVKQEGVINV